MPPNEIAGLVEKIDVILSVSNVLLLIRAVPSMGKTFVANRIWKVSY